MRQTASKKKKKEKLKNVRKLLSPTSLLFREEMEKITWKNQDVEFGGDQILTSWRGKEETKEIFSIETRGK